MRESEGEGVSRRERNHNSFSPRSGSHTRGSSIFVANIPYNLDRYGFKGIFAKIGPIQEIFLPKFQPNRSRFGFIKFENQEAVWKSIKWMNNKVVRGSKLVVQKARSERRGSRWNSRRDEFKRQDHRREAEDFVSEDTRKKGKCQNFGQYKFEDERFRNLEEEEQEKLKVVKGVVNEKMLEWLIPSLVGESDLPMAPEVIYNTLKEETFGLVKVVALEKSKFILSFINEDEADKALISCQKLFDTFVVVKKWSWNDSCEWRFAWIEVFGVPPLGWNSSNFSEIASRWGFFVRFHESPEDMENYESMKILIKTREFRQIEGDLLFYLKDNGFRVHVKEAVEEAIINSTIEANFVANHPQSPAKFRSTEENDSLGLNLKGDEDVNNIVKTPITEKGAGPEDIQPVGRQSITPLASTTLSSPIRKFPDVANPSSPKSFHSLSNKVSHQNESSFSSESIKNFSMTSAGTEVRETPGINLEFTPPRSPNDFTHNTPSPIPAGTAGGEVLEESPIEGSGRKNNKATEIEREEGHQPVSPTNFSKEPSVSSGPPPGFEILNTRRSVKKKGLHPSTSKVRDRSKLKKVVISSRKRRLSQRSDNSSSNNTSDSTMRMVNDTLKVGNIIGIKIKKNPEGVKRNLKNAIKDHKKMRVGPSGF